MTLNISASVQLQNGEVGRAPEWPRGANDQLIPPADRAEEKKGHLTAGRVPGNSVQVDDTGAVWSS